MEDGELRERLSKVEERGKSNTYRIEECEKKLEDNQKMIQSIALIAQKQEQMEKDVGEIRQDVKQIVSKSGKRWDGMIEKIVGILVASVLAFILIKLGLPA